MAGETKEQLDAKRTLEMAHDLRDALDRALMFVHRHGDCSYSDVRELHEVLVRAKWTLGPRPKKETSDG